ncbi:MAG: hypothetical protein K9N51_11940 [Candidatus Pacebacteria bacterium]|nr:hypothetical protein [Candidatus Paceibacterota bacterium]
MLKEIAQIWRKGGLMQDAVEELAQMVRDAEYVYTHAWEVWKGQAVVDTIEEPLRERDKLVNRQERAIRRKLVEHLSINPGVDASGCLAVMAMAKDCERIGDLAKDIFKLAVFMNGNKENLRYYKQLDAIQERISQHFPRLHRAIRESSDTMAHEILNAYDDVKTQCRKLQDALFEDDLPTREAAITALLIHFFTRINAHIGNTASGVVFPVENIDYVSRGLREEKEKGSSR